MNQFCSQCGKQLQKGVLICPECGFKNKATKKRSFLLPILLLLVLIISGLVYSYRNNLSEYIKEPSEIFNKIQDPDYEAKQKFKETYERYLLESKSHVDLLGYSRGLYITEGWLEAYYEIFEIKKEYDERSSLLKEIEDQSCYLHVNSDSECDQKIEKVKELNFKIQKKFLEKEGDKKYCCYDIFPGTCQKLDICAAQGYALCEICDERILELLNQAASIKNPQLSEDLLLLTTLLKESNEISFELMGIKINNYDFILNGLKQNELRVKKIKEMTDAEIREEFNKAEYLENVNHRHFKNTGYNRQSLLNYYEGAIENRSNTIIEESRQIHEYERSKEEKKEEIKAVISIINGLYDLNLSRP